MGEYRYFNKVKSELVQKFGNICDIDLEKCTDIFLYCKNRMKDFPKGCDEYLMWRIVKKHYRRAQDMTLDAIAESQFPGFKEWIGKPYPKK